jgi:hypothetical protein
MPAVGWLCQSTTKKGTPNIVARTIAAMTAEPSNPFAALDSVD